MAEPILDGELRAKIEDFRREFLPKLPPEIARTLGGSVAEMVGSGLAAKALGTGEKAPDFTLADARGGSITLSEKLGHGPAIVTFYRGGW